MINKERKVFALEAKSRSRKTQAAPLTDIALVEDETGSGVVYIRFSEDLVRFVGREMPQGIAPYDPAYIAVRYRPASKDWLVSSCYLRGGPEVPLWITTTRPQWSTRVKRMKSRDS